MKKIIKILTLVLGSNIFYVSADTKSCSDNFSHAVLIDVKIDTINIQCGVEQVKLPLIDAKLPNNTENGDFSSPVKTVIDAFSQLMKHDGELVYVRLGAIVGGAGFGLDDLSQQKPPFGGMVFDEIGSYVDLFSGNRDDYTYGYYLQLNNYESRLFDNRIVTLLLPTKGNRTFDLITSSYLGVEGFARIRVSGGQGIANIEIIPIEATGQYLNAYASIKKELKAKD